jgi:sulfotransferase
VGKTFHFLSGLHRSGNTVLSAILNQNPEVYVSPISALIEHTWVCHNTAQNFESTQVSLEDKNRSVNMIFRLPEIYYEDVSKPIVFDRHKSWINPGNIDLIKTYITKNPKIVFTTRPILECIASFIAIDKNAILDSMNYCQYVQDSNLTENENIVDYLMSEHSTFGFTRNLALNSIDNPDNFGMIHVVKYENLLNTPQETMDGIYDFLEIDKFKHNFTNIRKIEKYNDTAIGFSKDLHKVRRVLGKGDVRVEDYLTPRSIEKYKDVRYF